MKFEIKALEELKLSLVKGRETLRAKTEESKFLKEDAETKRLSKRIEKVEYWTAQLDIAIHRLSAKPKTKAFSPPSRVEVHALAKDRYPNWAADDVDAWFNHFESVGWVVGGKTRMKCWESALANGYRRYLERAPMKAPVTKLVQNDDPPGWVDFLKHKGRAYKAFKYALPHHVEDYRAWRDKRRA